MREFRCMPKVTASELLLFLAEHEGFETSERLLNGNTTSEEMKTVLRELSAVLGRAAAQDVLNVREELASNGHLSRRTRELISCLSPREEQRLLSAFGIIDDE